MTLKWMAVVVAAVSVTLCVTANVVVGTVERRAAFRSRQPLRYHRAGTAIVLAVVAELHERLNGRITALTEFLVARLNEIDARTGDRNTGFVEGYLLSHGQDAAVVPIGAADARAPSADGEATTRSSNASGSEPGSTGVRWRACGRSNLGNQQPTSL